MNDLKCDFRPEGFINTIHLKYGGRCGVEEFGGVTIHIGEKPGGGVMTRAQATALHAFLTACLEKFDTVPPVELFPGVPTPWKDEAAWLARKLADKPQNYVSRAVLDDKFPPISFPVLGDGGLKHDSDQEP